MKKQKWLSTDRNTNVPHYWIGVRIQSQWKLKTLLERSAWYINRQYFRQTGSWRVPSFSRHFQDLISVISLSAPLIERTHTISVEYLRWHTINTTLLHTRTHLGPIGGPRRVVSVTTEWMPSYPCYINKSADGIFNTTGCRLSHPTSIEQRHRQFLVKNYSTLVWRETRPRQ